MADDKKLNRDLFGLREVLWDTLDQVRNRDIDMDRAAVIIKAGDSIMNSFKLELANKALQLQTSKGKPPKELPAPEPQPEEAQLPAPEQQLEETRGVEARIGNDGEGAGA